MDEFSIFGYDTKGLKKSYCDYNPRGMMPHPHFGRQCLAGAVGVVLILSQSMLMFIGIPLLGYFLASPKEIQGVFSGLCPECSEPLRLSPQMKKVRCPACRGDVYRINQTLFH